MKELKAAVKSAVRVIKDRGDLAFLAMSRKIESHLRDQVAICLHGKSFFPTVEVPLGKIFEKVGGGRSCDSYVGAAEELLNNIPEDLGEALGDRSGVAGGLIKKKGGVDLCLWHKNKLKFGIEVKQMYEFDLRQHGVEAGVRKGIALDVLRLQCLADSLGAKREKFAVLVFLVGVKRSGDILNEDRLSFGFPYWRGRYGLREFLDNNGRNADCVFDGDDYVIWPNSDIGCGCCKILGPEAIGCEFGLSVSLSAWLLRLPVRKI